MEVEGSTGSDRRVGQINSIQTNSISVTWWEEDRSVEGINKIQLPKFLRPTAEGDVIAIPDISAIVFVFNEEIIAKYTVRYVYGMRNMYTTSRVLQWFLTCQSVSYIIFDCLSRASMELQRLLSNKRINQFACSSTSVQFSHLAWKYLVEKIGTPVHTNTKVCTVSTMRSNDLSMVKVKSKVPCQILRLEEVHLIVRLIEVLGASAVVGVRKTLPAISKKLSNSEGAFVTARGGVQLQDVINLIDVSSNNLPIPQRFTWNANGRRGIDFVFYPTQCVVRISIRYRNFTVSRAMEKLRQLGIGTSTDPGTQLNDDELEHLLRGEIN